MKWRLRTLCLLTALAVWLQGPGCGGENRIKISSPKGATAIGSPFPADIEIPSIEALRDRAWVVTSAPPIGLYRFDLTSPGHPYRFDFFDLSAVVAGVPNELVIVDERTALVTTSAGDAVIELDPGTGEVRAEVDIDSPVTLPRTYRDSEGRRVRQITPSFAAGAALIRDRLYVVTSNLKAAGADPVCDPGTVLVFDRDAGSEGRAYRPSAKPVIVTTGFNPTEITPYGTDLLLVTNTGVLAIREGSGLPLTEATVDIIDTTSDRIVGSIPMGLTAPSFKPISLTPDWERGFLGSAAYNHVYELDLAGLNQLIGTEPLFPPRFPERLKAGGGNPIVVTEGPAFSKEFVVQVEISASGAVAMATAFNSGTLGVIDLSSIPAQPFPEAIRITDPVPSLNEVGPGPLAVRPGVRGVDYTGPDLFILTGAPTGLLVTLETPF